MEKTAEKTAKEGILINFYEVEYQRSKQAFHSLNRSIEEFVKVYNNQFVPETEMEPITLPMLKDIIRSGFNALEQKISRYVESQRRPLQKHFLEACYVQAELIKKSLDAIWTGSDMNAGTWKNIPSEFWDPDKLSWNDNLSLNLDDEFFEGIRPQFELRISTPLELEIYDLYKELALAHNKFFEAIERNNLWTHRNFNGLFGTGGTVSCTKVEADPKRLFPLRKIPK